MKNHRPSARWICHELQGEHPQILIRAQNRDPVAAFVERWQPELNEFVPMNTRHGDPGSAQFLAAYAIASSGGNPLYRHPDRGRTRHIWQNFPKETLQNGKPAEVYCDYGLFAIPLPWARLAASQPELSPDDLLKPEVQFRIIAILIAAYNGNYRRERKTSPGPVQTALYLHGSTFGTAHDNPFRIHYRGTFLEDFIAAYNGYPKPQKETSHEQEKQSAA